MIPVVLFARPPRPGLVKTRLIPDIGAAAATRVYRYCLEYSLELVRRCGLDYQLYLSRDSDDELFQDERYLIQKGADLGARMHNALADLLAAGNDGAIIIGSDCLDLTPGHLQSAAQALANHELVLIPAFDGGFALLGCTEANPELFDSVSWSTDQVLAQTIANAERSNYRLCLLETVRDIDTLQDLEQYPELLSLITSS
ncbi:MAG: TIGR04282 family arsenosugar biosynthesis glycosyltransferase [Gammaproteobacteria bacterium]|nr:TIGR04282 family arsenosugar biosynthesis glycosyltransferase [Gammaproteobacteria bacterium]